MVWGDFWLCNVGPKKTCAMRAIRYNFIGSAPPVEVDRDELVESEVETGSWFHFFFFPPAIEIGGFHK